MLQSCSIISLRGMLHPLAHGSTVTQLGPPARRAVNTEGTCVLRVLHHHCTSVLVFKWLHRLDFSSPGVNGNRAFLIAVQDLAIYVSLPAPLLFRTLISLGQPLLGRGRGAWNRSPFAVWVCSSCPAGCFSVKWAQWLSPSLGSNPSRGFHNLPVKAWLGRWAAAAWENGTRITFLSPGIGRLANITARRGC